MGDVNVSWQKAFHEENKLPRTDGSGVLALSAFMLSSLSNGVARKKLVKEMWDSGAEIMVRSARLRPPSCKWMMHSHLLQVLIDHNTTAGFECIAQAREDLLRMGKREMEDPTAEDWPVRGSHVVAPVSNNFLLRSERRADVHVACSVLTTAPVPSTTWGPSRLCAVFHNVSSAPRSCVRLSTQSLVTKTLAIRTLSSAGAPGQSVRRASLAVSATLANVRLRSSLLLSPP